MATTQELLAQSLLQQGNNANVDPLSRGIASFLGARNLRQEEQRQKELKATQQNALVEALVASGADKDAVQGLALGGGTDALRQALADRLKPQSPVTLSQGQQLVNPVSGKMIAQVAPKPITASAGSSLLDPLTGQLVGQAPFSDFERQKEMFNQRTKLEELELKRAKENREIDEKGANQRVEGYQLQKGFKPSSTDVTQFKKVAASGRTILNSVNRLEDIFDKTGAEIGFGADMRKMEQIRNGLVFEIAKLQEQGAIQAEDARRIDAFLPDPTSWSGWTTNKENLKAEFKQFKEVINDIIDQKAKISGYVKAGQGKKQTTQQYTPQQAIEELKRRGKL